MQIHSNKIFRFRLWFIFIILFQCLTVFTATKFQTVGHPLIISPHFKPIVYHNSKVFVVNTNADTLDVIDAKTNKVIKRVSTGVDPVSVAIRPDGKEIWVSNHISDSVSVIDNDLSSKTYLTVIATIQQIDIQRNTTAFDEPVGIAFADNSKAYVALSSTNRIAVVDIASRKVTKFLQIKSQEPRALIVSKDRLYVIPFESGNQTQISSGNKIDGVKVTVNKRKLASSFDTSALTLDIVKRKEMPDRDLYIFDTKTDREIKNISSLGTLQYGLTVADNGNIFIAQTDARNHINGKSGTKKHALKELDNRPWLNQITMISPDGKIKVINFEPLPPKSPTTESAVSTPFGIELSKDSKIIFLTAAGSHKLVTMTTDGEILSQVDVGAVPRGIALQTDDQGNPNVAWVMNAASNSVTKVAVSKTSKLKVLETIALVDPTPIKKKQGRIAFNSAKASSNGTFSCASCHPDGHTDQLLWVLDTPFIKNANQVEPRLAQQLRGLLGTAPYHWDGVPGDPYGGGNATTDQQLKPNSDINNMESATRHLIDAGLGSTMLKPGSMTKNNEGKKGLLTKKERDDMAHFLLNIPHVPSRARSFNNVLSANAKLGIERFHITGANDPKHLSTNVCGACHSMPYLQTTSSGGMDVPSFMGALDRYMVQAQGRQNVVDLPRIKKIMDNGYLEEDLWRAVTTMNKEDRMKPLVDMFREATTSFSGAFGRQFTLDKNTNNKPETKILWDALEKDARQGGVVLEVDGHLTKSGQITLQYSQGTYMHKAGTVTRKQLEDMSSKGDFIGTFTGRHGADTNSPPPALWTKGPHHVQRGIQIFPRVNKSTSSMILSAQYLKGNAIILVDGIKVNANLKMLVDGVIEVMLADLPKKGIHFLQVQNPGSFFSNEFIFFSENKHEAVERYRQEKDYLLTLTLNSAIIHNNKEEAEILLEAGANTYLPEINSSGLMIQPILLAALYGRHDFIPLLVQNGADVSVKDKHGDTALHLASKIGRTKTIQQLLKAGANKNTRNIYNKTAGEITGNHLNHISQIKGMYHEFRYPMLEIDFKAANKQRKTIKKLLK